MAANSLAECFSVSVPVVAVQFFDAAGISLVDELIKCCFVMVNGVNTDSTLHISCVFVPTTVGQKLICSFASETELFHSPNDVTKFFLEFQQFMCTMLIDKLNARRAEIDMDILDLIDVKPLYNQFNYVCSS
ncbi:E4 ORF2 [Bottlenose dolphin adenovirus 1]|uniref:E4 ORF2 n=1 Tax=Bottlenose dolphin adenovirus 1 TaxID=1714377 RepID=A0A1X7MMK7_9ADEN|nr:E4 ORF2 [Bottlenose dolphin adenovirus 1]SMG83461.1 E4 ORF2 [Bottlenose dolphin adenovirus 1]